MSFKKFREYVGGKGKLVEKPKVKDIADDVEGEPNKPPKENKKLRKGKAQPQVKEYLDGNGKLVDKPGESVNGDVSIVQKPAPQAAVTSGKGWDAQAQPVTGQAKPYQNPTTPSTPPKGESGLGDQGDKNLLYDPSKGKPGDSPNVPGGTTIKDLATKTEQFLKKTREMNLSEYFGVIYEEGALDRDPRAVQYVAHLCKENKVALEALVHELRRKELLGEVLSLMMEYPETYTGLTSLFGESNERCRSFARALNEEVGPPIGLEDLEDDEEEDDELGGEFDDEDEDLGGMGDEFDDDEEDDEFDDEEDDELDGEEDLDNGDMDDEDIGDEEGGMMGKMMGKHTGMGKMKRKRRGPRGMKGLMGALAKHPGLRDFMKV